MKKIAHISDLHFGTEDNAVKEGLLDELNEPGVNLIVVSGDITQRARAGQFKSAAEYFKRMKKPVLAIPGNHDVPLFNLFRRFIYPYSGYYKYINRNLNPSFEDDEILLLALNTSRSLTWKNGRISEQQMELIERFFCSRGNEKLKIVVTHHPFIPPPGNPGIKLVGRSVRTLEMLDKCGIQLLLAGHIHHGYSGDVRPYYPKHNSSVISVQAGTAISNRLRNEPNAYNLLSVDINKIKIDIRRWNGEVFVNEVHTSYIKIEQEWIREI